MALYRDASAHLIDCHARSHRRLFSFVFIVHRCLALRSLAATMLRIDPAAPRMRGLPDYAELEEAEKAKDRKHCCEAQA